MTTASSLPGAVEEALDVWLGTHDDVAPGLVEGLYLVGSLALGDWQPGSDIDIVAFTTGPATDEQVVAMRAAHDAVVAAVPNRDIDGPRLAWSDIAAPPAPIVRPWSLAGEFRHDDGCFEISPVTWSTLGTHGVVVRGPAVSDLSVAVDPDATRAFVLDNTASYWRSVAGTVRGALDDPGRQTFRSEMTSWCVLGLARMLYTARTGDVASKSAAGDWLTGELPQHRALVEHALTIRRSTDPPPDDRETVAATADYMDHVADLVAAPGR